MINKSIQIKLFLVIVIFILSIVQLLALNWYSTKGNDLTAFTQEIEEIQKQNVNIAQKIASVSAMSMISVRADKLNINKNIPLFSFNTPIPIAYNIEPAM